MLLIINDDNAYLTWLAKHPGGYVVNANNPPNSSYLMLHRSTCADISSPRRTNWTTPDMMKVCSNDVSELEYWAVKETGGSLRPCLRCRPTLGEESQATTPPPYVSQPISRAALSLELPADRSPFVAYPGAGRELLGRRNGGNCRRGYGDRLLQLTGVGVCGYCQLPLTSSYEFWLMMQVDHVVPLTMGKQMLLPLEWVDDYANCLLACSACNTFQNHYCNVDGHPIPTTVEQFFDLRDTVYQERKIGIMNCQKSELEFYANRSWRRPSQ